MTDDPGKPFLIIISFFVAGTRDGAGQERRGTIVGFRPVEIQDLRGGAAQYRHHGAKGL